jgi:hypothetical protein
VKKTAMPTTNTISQAIVHRLLRGTTRETTGLFPSAKWSLPPEALDDSPNTGDDASDTDEGRPPPVRSPSLPRQCPRERLPTAPEPEIPEAEQPGQDTEEDQLIHGKEMMARVREASSRDYGITGPEGRRMHADCQPAVVPPKALRSREATLDQATVPFLDR